MKILDTRMFGPVSPEFIVDCAVTNQVREKIGDGRPLVVLDSDHHAAHVYKELETYGPLVKTGDYLIVEDTNVNGHPIASRLWGGTHGGGRTISRRK